MRIPFISRLMPRSTRAADVFVIANSAQGVHFVQVKYVAGRPRVTTYAYHQLAASKSSVPASSVLDKIRTGMGVGDFRFATLLGQGEYQLLQVEAPNVPEEEMKAAVRWSIKDSLNFHVDDATLDILSIPKQPGVESKKSLYVVVASNELIRKRIELFERANINLGVIDIPEMAQRNIAALYEHEGRALALLAFDEHGGLLTFTSDGELFLARRIDISIGQLQDANEALRQQYLDRLELEMQRSMDHFDRQFKHLPLRRLLVSAPESAGLIALLAASLDLPVESLDLNEALDLSGVPQLSGDEARVFALHALGAAMRQEGQAA